MYFLIKKFIIYISRKIILAEFNYNIYNKKLFVIVAVIKKLKIYIKSVSEITVFIDYKNLIKFYIIK